MSKDDSKHFKGTSGHKAIEESTPPLFDKGHVNYEGIVAHREEFMRKSVEQIATLLTNNGYEFKVHPSKNPNSTAQIIEITNGSKIRNIDHVQVSLNGSRRHRNVPYVKISTSNEGKIKIIDGTPKNYVTDGKEKVRLIFREE